MRLYARCCLSISLAVVLALAGEPAGAYQVPVKGPVVDGYRPPSTPYGIGNRGLDYSTTPGSAVVASEGGLVSFAGQVGGDLYVSVDHADGLRTTYGSLEKITVSIGQSVAAGETVGLAGSILHFGARRGTDYVDPSVLLNSRVHLVALGQGVDSDSLESDPAGLFQSISGGDWQWLVDAASPRNPNMGSPSGKGLGAEASSGSASGESSEPKFSTQSTGLPPKGTERVQWLLLASHTVPGIGVFVLLLMVAMSVVLLRRTRTAFGSKQKRVRGRR